MNSHTTSKSILLLLPILAVVMAFGVGVPGAAALSCPVVLPDKGIDCTGGGATWSWCGPLPPAAGGSCQAEPVCPRGGDPAAYTRLNCTACACQCPLDLGYGSGTLAQLDCTATADNNCQPRDLTCETVYNRNFACASQSAIAGANCGSCRTGYVNCGAAICEKNNPPPTCKDPDVWDECTDTCSYKYVLTNYPTPVSTSQMAFPSISGNFAISKTGAASDDGYLFLPNGGRIRVDDDSTSELAVGNWAAGSTGFRMKLLGGLYSDEGISLITGDDSVFPGHPGTLEANEVCLGDEIFCRNTWPIGLPEGIVPQHSTLRFDGITWKESSFLRNDEQSLAVGVALGQSAGWLLDLRKGAGSSVNNAMINLDDRVGSLWTGLRLARVLGGDPNKEKWFMGMSDANDKFHLQYDGIVNNRFLTVDTTGYVGIGEQSPQDKLHMTNGNIRLSRNDGLDATIKMTGTPLNRAWQIGYHAATGDFRLSKSIANLDLPVLAVTNNDRYVGVNRESPGYPLDVWSANGTAMMRLVQNSDTSFWTGIQLARYTTADPSPQEKWFVGMPDAASGGDKFLIRRSSSSNDFVINTNGWVGLNDPTPEAQLTVQGPQAGIRVENTGAANAPFVHLYNQGGNEYVMLVDPSDNDWFKIAEGSAGSFVSRITVGDKGYIGLNKDNPTYLLDIANRDTGTNSVIRVNQEFAGTTDAMGLQLSRQANKKWFVGMEPTGHLTTPESFRIIQGGAPDVDRLVVDVAGNVGIGVEPGAQYRLDVSGGRIRAHSMRLTNDVDGNPPSVGGGAQILAAKNTDGDLIWVDKPIGLPSTGLTHGQTIRYDGAAGWIATLNLFNNGTRVGINETDPGYPLDVAPAGTSSDLPMIRVHGPSSGRRWSGLRLDRAKDSEQWMIGMDDIDEDLIIRRAGTDNPVVIKSTNGNVGIGDQNPAQTFSVGSAGSFQVRGSDGHARIGTAAISNNAILNIQQEMNATGSDSGISLVVDGRAADASNPLNGISVAAQSFETQNSVRGLNVVGTNHAAAATPSVVGGIIRATNTAGNPSEMVAVDAGVDISGGSPSNVYGVRSVTNDGGNIAYAGYFSAENATTQSYGVYSANGNNYMRNWLAMGAGNNVPQYPIDIYSDGGNAVVRVGQPDAGANSNMRTGLRFDKGAAEWWFMGMEQNSNTVVFKNAGSTKMAIQADGKVGINKSNPATALDVNGRVTTTEFTMTSGAGTDLVLKSNATGDAYWGVVVYADDCTGGKFHHLTAATYNGSQGGYSGMNGRCGSDPVSLKPYHVCTAEDILRSVRCAPGTLPASPEQAWVSVGPPGYTSPAVNDCNGWTTSNSVTTKAYGAFWKFNGAVGGYGASTTCSELKKVACCTPL